MREASKVLQDELPRSPIMPNPNEAILARNWPDPVGCIQYMQIRRSCRFRGEDLTDWSKPILESTTFENISGSSIQENKILQIRTAQIWNTKNSISTLEYEERITSAKQVDIQSYVQKLQRIPSAA